MNILALKIRAFGWMLRGTEGGDGGSGEGVGGSDHDMGRGPSSPDFGGGGNGNTTSNDQSAMDAAVQAANEANAEDQAKADRQTAELGSDVAGWSSGLGALGMGANPSEPTTVDKQQQSLINHMKADPKSDESHPFSIMDRMKSAAYGWGLRDFGVTSADVQAQEAADPALADVRMGKVAGIINGVGQMAISATPLGRMTMGAANVANNIDRGQDAGEAIGGFAKGTLAGYAIGPINKALGGVLGNDTMSAIGDYNKAAAIGNVLGISDAPGVNPGAMAVGAVFGKSGTPQATNPTTGAGLTTPDGVSVPGIGGWSTGGGSSSGSVTPQGVKDQATTGAIDASVGSGLDLSLFKKDSLIGRALATLQSNRLATKEAKGY